MAEARNRGVASVTPDGSGSPNKIRFYLIMRISQSVPRNSFLRRRY